MDCLFCKITSGDIPSQKIYEDSEVLAFKDVSPQAPIHYLFIPKVHVESLDDLKPEQLSLVTHLYRAIQKVSRLEGFAESGFRTVINTNKNGAQTVFHLHVHVLAGAVLGGNMSGR